MTTVSAHEPSDALTYTALIRTQDSLPRVAQTIASLRAQHLKPVEIVAVDASREASEKEELAKLVDRVVDYPDLPFNYSKAINLGIARCATPYVLIISAHVRLDGAELIKRGIDEVRVKNATGFYLQTSPDERWSVTKIDCSNFNGRNGLSNTCAFLPTRTVTDRPFREEVFSAEDQEWAAHHFRSMNAAILRIRTTGLHYENPRWNELKYINEEVSIAYFTCREKLGTRYLVTRLFKCGIALARGRLARARTEWIIFRALVQARSTPPMRTSRYF